MCKLLADELTWATLFAVLGDKRLTEGSIAAVKDGKEALVDHPGFVFRDARSVVKNYVEAQGISPAIIIVQATRKQITQVAKSRPDAKAMQRDVKDMDDIIARAVPYNRLEGFGKVVVVERKIARDIRRVRELMRTAKNPGPEREVGFLLDGRK